MASLIQNTGLYGSFRIKTAVLIVAANILFISGSDAQYFGRNKPGYRKFNFDVLQTPHFEIYHYLKNDSLINTLSQWSEKWYQIHQKFFLDTFKIKNPIIIYNNHPDFQQTNTVSSLIGSGTGGVTEALKNRVIMPVASSLAQTDHVLGHELVHAFQYHMFLKNSSLEEMSINNVPLWMIEGMAEYLSIGSIDPNTAMWMRDAILNNDFPTIKQLSTDYKYFPYRYGQAFWAMAGKTWGDTVLVSLLERTAYLGFNKAADSVLKFNEKALSGMWRSATETHFRPYLKRTADTLTGKALISEKNGGRINISPSISPDGKYLAFFSEKNVFTLDLFLADAINGKIVKKLSSVVRNNEIDDFDFLESSGTWSPDGKKFAFVVFSNGENRLAILDVEKTRITKEYEIKGVPSFSNPAWSPDGRKIVISGLVDGINDLYLFYPESGKVEKLTGDFTSNLHPAWSPDGRFVVFAQEKVNKDLNQRKYSFNLAILDVKERSVRRIDVFDDAYNLNPCFSPDGRFIYFLSDADGFRNLYKYDLASNTVFRLTDYMTGISGITAFSPAISISTGGKLIAYNYYFKSKYQIIVASENEFQGTEVDRDYVNFAAGTLPPLKHIAINLVDTTLYNRQVIADIPGDSLKNMQYRPKFKLDYISNNASIGVSTGIYRNSMGGSINMIFSDMVGNHQLYSSLALNGEIYDFGGQVAYINQKGKIKWGGGISHIPYQAGSMFIMRDTINYQDTRMPVDNLVLDLLRMFEDNISVFASWPMSQTRRFEGTISSSWYYYRIDRYNNYYFLNGLPIGTKREKLDAPKGNNYQQISLAYVEDNSFFGMTSPMNGHRARYQIEKYFGAADVFTTLFDFRKYFFTKPIGFAFRLYNYGMYGKDAEGGVIPPLYIGYPWLLRGYENVSYSSDGTLEGNTFNVTWLTGSKIALANAELRLPFTGPERLALIKSKWLLTDINLFFDSGLAWNSDSKITFNLNPAAGAGENERFPLFSTGASIRLNLLGYIVIEPFYAFPLQNGGFKNGVFGLNFIPGW
ncbi:MAG: PD40 domain-containing protein [Bacteroidales bacterium]|nr:PD40 domain-containing protein [Bacteroidales bacterium]